MQLSLVHARIPSDIAMCGIYASLGIYIYVCVCVGGGEHASLGLYVWGNTHP